MYNGDRQYLKTIFQHFGQTEAEEILESERREIDIFFTPDPEKAPAVNNLGLLGRLAANPAAFEFFSHPVQPDEIRNSLVKILELNEELESNATEENRTFTEAESAHLWIFTPTASAAVLADFDATLDLENFPGGVYFLPKGLLSAIIVIHELPPTPETLCLRILGTGEVRKQALQELFQLPPEHPIRSTALKLMEQFRTSLETKPDLSPEEKEFLMELSPLYLQQLQKAKEEGIQQGVQQGVQQGIQQGARQEQRLMVESMLQVKFGVVDAELAQIIEGLIEIPTLERTQLIWQLSREDLLARFSRGGEG